MCSGRFLSQNLNLNVQTVVLVAILCPADTLRLPPSSNMRFISSTRKWIPKGFASIKIMRFKTSITDRTSKSCASSSGGAWEQAGEEKQKAASADKDKTEEAPPLPLVMSRY